MKTIIIKNPTEKDERQYLEFVKEKIKQVIEQIEANIKNYATDLQAQKNYLWENKAGMDHVEKVSVRQTVTQQATSAESALEKRNKIVKLLKSPYFGRFDFIEKEKEEVLEVYIGIYSFVDLENNNIIFDWRAPVSSMFYDFEVGEASYEAPNGNISGAILLKRQYRIRKSKFEFMIESSLNIHDDILQKELSSASSDRMKNIVATIQRDQNAIIRNENSHVLIFRVLPVREKHLLHCTGLLFCCIATKTV